MATTNTAEAASGATTITVGSTSGMSVGSRIFIERRSEASSTTDYAEATTQEYDYVISVGGDGTILRSANEIGELSMKDGWRANGRIKKQTIAANTTHEGKLRVTGSGDFSMSLAVKVDQLGDWVLDLNLPEKRSND